MTDLNVELADGIAPVSNPPVAVILGMHRSGTSLIAGLLARAGAWIGEERELLPARPDNPTGFFERADVVALNEELLSTLGSSWECPAPADRVGTADQGVFEQVRQLWSEILERCPAASPMALKDPRLCVLWPLWKRALDLEVTVVLALRNPLEIARSLQERDGLSIPVGLALWETYTVGALNAAAAETRVHVFPYLQALDASAAARLVRAVAHDIGLELGHTDLVGWLSGLAQQSLHRHRATAEELAQHLSVSQQALWQMLSALPDGPVKLALPEWARQVSADSITLLREMDESELHLPSRFASVPSSSRTLDGIEPVTGPRQLQELQRARRTIEGLKQRESSLSSLVNDLRGEVADLTRQHAESEASLERAEATIRQVTTRWLYRELALLASELRLQDAEKRLNMLSMKAGRLASAVASRDAEVEVLRRRTSGLERGFGSVSEDLAAARVEVSESQRRIVELTGALSSARADTADAKARSLKESKRARELEMACDRERRQLTRMSEMLATRQASLKLLSSRARDSDARAEALSQELDELGTHMTTAQAQIHELSAALEEARSTVIERSDLVARLEAELDEHVTGRAGLHAALAQERAVVHDLNKALDEVRSALAESCATVAQLEGEIHEHVVTRSQLDSALAHERWVIHELVRSESWRLGHALTAPGHLAKRALLRRPLRTMGRQSSRVGASGKRVIARDGTEIEIVWSSRSSYARRKLALIAGHDSRHIIGHALLHMGSQLRAAGWEPLLMLSNRVDPDWLSSSGRVLSASFAGVFTAEHTGRDFCSWRLMLTCDLGLDRAKELLLLNDSTIGPLSSPTSFLKALRDKRRDVCGAVESGVPEPHLQSWLLWFGRKVLRDGALVEYLSRDLPGLSKRELIERMEIPLAGWFAERGYRVGAVLPALSTCAGPHNPSTTQWAKLLELGVPFVKREIFTHPDFIAQFPQDETIIRLQALSSHNVGDLVRDSLAQL